MPLPVVVQMRQNGLTVLAGGLADSDAFYQSLDGLDLGRG
jgi:hypothetical protein